MKSAESCSKHGPSIALTPHLDRKLPRIKSSGDPLLPRRAAEACDDGIGSPCFEGHSQTQDFWASLLRRHGQTKDLLQGRVVYSRITSLGFDRITFLANWVIEMYGNCGSMEEAQCVFSHLGNPNVYSFNILLKALGHNGLVDEAVKVFWAMPCWDIVSWNALIKAFSHWRRYEEALDFYGQMLSKDVRPDKITFVSALNVCANIASFEIGLEIHHSVVVHGFEADIVLGTSLVTLYGKCGRVAHARTVFDRITSHDIVCWNAMIAAYAQNNCCHGTLFLFHEMMYRGMKPNNISFVIVLDACTSQKVLLEGKKVHALVNSSGIVQDVSVGNTLLNMYGKCGSLDDAKNVFQRMPLCDTVSWNAMITVLSVNEEDDEALNLFYGMQHEGLKPDNVTFVCGINACANSSALKEGRLVHHFLLNNNQIAEIMLDNVLIHMYGKCDSLEDAKKTFFEMCSRDVFSWNAIIAAFSRNGQNEIPLSLFQQMQMEGLSPDSVTFTAVLDSCSSIKSLQKAHEMCVSLVHLPDCYDACVGTSLINMYGKCRDLQKAGDIFQEIKLQKISVWNAYMTALVDNGEDRAALALFHKIQLHGMKPDKVSFACAVDACASLTAFDDGNAIHNSIIDSGHEQDIVVGTALVNMYGKCGGINKAKNVFLKMRSWDIVLCNAMISAFAQSGETVEPMYVFSQMEFYGIKPDPITYISILTVCSHTGEADLGIHCFVSMVQKHDIVQSDDHCVCLVDMLGRAGRLDEAEGFIKCKLLENCVLVWLALLGACRIHGDMERGMHAAERCLESKSDDSAVYVALANIYAESATVAD